MKHALRGVPEAIVLDLEHSQYQDIHKEDEHTRPESHSCQDNITN